MDRTLGTGSFGRVMLVQERAGLEYRAIKIISKDRVIKTRQVCCVSAFLRNRWSTPSMRRTFSSALTASSSSGSTTTSKIRATSTSFWSS